MRLTESVTAFICALYAHVLGRKDVLPGHDFFADLNGDSLAAAQIIVVLEDLFAINIADAFFDDSSAGAIAPILERHLQSRAAGGCAWPAGSSLMGNELTDDVARLRERFTAAQRSAFK